MTNAVIYARYSPGPNQTDQSIEGQIHECTRFCEDNDLRIVGTYIDRKQTGRNDNRADFQKMLRDSSRRGFSTVVVWKIDRFGRRGAQALFGRLARDLVEPFQLVFVHVRRTVLT